MRRGLAWIGCRACVGFGVVKGSGVARSAGCTIRCRVLDRGFGDGGGGGGGWTLCWVVVMVMMGSRRNSD